MIAEETKTDETPVFKAVFLTQADRMWIANTLERAAREWAEMGDCQRGAQQQMRDRAILINTALAERMR